jgi:hypothetical protein
MEQLEPRFLRALTWASRELSRVLGKEQQLVPPASISDVLTLADLQLNLCGWRKFRTSLDCQKKTGRGSILTEEDVRTLIQTAARRSKRRGRGKGKKKCKQTLAEHLQEETIITLKQHRSSCDGDDDQPPQSSFICGGMILFLDVVQSQGCTNLNHSIDTFKAAAAMWDDLSPEVQQVYLEKAALAAAAAPVAAASTINPEIGMFVDVLFDDTPYRGRVVAALRAPKWCCSRHAGDNQDYEWLLHVYWDEESEGYDNIEFPAYDVLIVPDEGDGATDGPEPSGPAQKARCPVPEPHSGPDFATMSERQVAGYLGLQQKQAAISTGSRQPQRVAGISQAGCPHGAVHESNGCNFYREADQGRLKGLGIMVDGFGDCVIYRSVPAENAKLMTSYGVDELGNPVRRLHYRNAAKTVDNYVWSTDTADVLRCSARSHSHLGGQSCVFVGCAWACRRDAAASTEEPLPVLLLTPADSPTPTGQQLQSKVALASTDLGNAEPGVPLVGLLPLRLKKAQAQATTPAPRQVQRGRKRKLAEQPVDKGRTPGEKGGWVCSGCTFSSNAASAMYCGVCYRGRPRQRTPVHAVE